MDRHDAFHLLVIRLLSLILRIVWIMGKRELRKIIPYEIGTVMDKVDDVITDANDWINSHLEDK